MKLFFRTAAGLLTLVSLQLAAEVDAAAGQAKSAICAACHGSDGNSMVALWPKLAGQHGEYLVRQTSLIKSGARPVPEMVGIVAAVSEQDIANISAYLSSQTMSGGVADDSLVAIGKSIYQAGNPESGVPACMACHGPAGEGNPIAGYPVVAGQHATYSASMLKRFRSGDNWGEDDAGSAVMNGVAAKLTDTEIAAVSSYMQGLYRRDQ
jgi:cytochrome c553